MYYFPSLTSFIFVRNFVERSFQFYMMIQQSTRGGAIKGAAVMGDDGTGKDKEPERVTVATELSIVANESRWSGAMMRQTRVESETERVIAIVEREHCRKTREAKETAANASSDDTVRTDI
jgi:hypothetical protein